LIFLRGKAVQPVRNGIEVKPPGGLFSSYAGAVGRSRSQDRNGRFQVSAGAEVNPVRVQFIASMQFSSRARNKSHLQSVDTRTCKFAMSVFCQEISCKGSEATAKLFGSCLRESARASMLARTN
jgi:hypothetical protein